ncbi:MAG: uroporphyrinogen-III synthase [Acidobacteria bacterium]|nr:uroporphyrinogen-III synthase [Acidobacteriota bacterium]
MATGVRVVVVREWEHGDSVARWLTIPFHRVAATRTEIRATNDVRREVAISAAGAAWLVVTSARSVEPLGDARDLVAPATRLAAVGEVTASALRDAGWSPDVVGTSGALSLLEVLTPSPVLLVGAEQMRPELSDALERRGVEVRRVTLYRTVPRALSDEERQLLANAEVVLVGAPSTWRVVAPDVAPGAVVVVPGETTRRDVLKDHDDVLVGWGEEWPSAYTILTKRFHDIGPGDVTPNG